MKKMICDICGLETDTNKYQEKTNSGYVEVDACSECMEKIRTAERNNFINNIRKAIGMEVKE